MIIYHLSFNQPKYPDEKNKPPKSYGSFSTTLKGEVVRSIGEREIADYLSHLGIDYIYEHKIKNLLPDFYLPKFRMVIEYWGLAFVDNKVGANYRKNMLRKLKKYKKMNFQLLSLFPEDIQTGNFKKKIKQYLTL